MKLSLPPNLQYMDETLGTVYPFSLHEKGWAQNEADTSWS